MALYFAYGSNLDPAGMASRCPAAVVVGRARLAHWRLAFRGVADVEPHRDAAVEGLLWECTAECIRSLDRYEGVAGGFYRKEQLTVETDHGPQQALVYVMNVTRYDRACLPSAGYLDTIVRGYAEFGLPVRKLRAALRRAEAQARQKATGWVDDGRKRLRPKGQRPRPRRAGKRAGDPAERKRVKRVLVAYEDVELFTDDQLMDMGFTKADALELRLEAGVSGRRIA